MNQILKNRWLNIIVIVLLIANIVSVALFWMQQPKDRVPKSQRGEVVEFLVHELKLTDTQKEALVVLRKAHRESMETYRRSQENLKDQFFGLVKNAEATDVEINNILNEVSAIDKAIDLLTFNHFKSIRKICTPSQQVKFDEIIEEAIKMMHPAGGGRPPMQGPQDNPPRDASMQDRPLIEPPPPHARE